MQFQSNLINLNIERPKNIESTALGVGMLAGLKAGFWKNEKDMFEKRKIDKIFTCKMKDLERNKYFNSWEKAIRMAMKK